MSRIDIVAINESGHVIAMAESDKGAGDRAFSRDYSRKFRVEKMPVEEACDRHMAYLATIPAFQSIIGKEPRK